MDDLISRAAAIEAIVSATVFPDAEYIKNLCQNPANSEDWLGGVCDAINAVEDVNAVDAVPVAKYKAEIETLRSRYYPGAEDAFGRKAYGCLKIVPVSYGTKSVDAIPVEWLREKMQKPQMTCANPFGYVLAEWLEEQEAR